MQKAHHPSIGFFLDFFILGVGAASLLGFLGRLDWTLDLFSHFRVQYLVLHFFALLAAWGVKRPRSVWVAGGFVIFHLWFIIPFYVPKRPVSIPGPTYRLLSANVLRDNPDFDRVRALIQTTDPDILLLQEMNQRWLDALSLTADYPYQVTFPRDDYFGYAFFSKFPIVQSQNYHLQEGYYALIAEVQLDGQTLTFIGTHPPPPNWEGSAQRRNAQLKMMVTLADAQPGNVLVAGDLNITTWSPFFADAFENSALLDSRLGFGIQPSWPTNRPFFLRIPIDHIFTTASITILHRATGPEIGSDHLPVILDFTIP
jgi:endonuclease/exonuclease/phosphatase (EEP) superfamily protein YafD